MPIADRAELRSSSSRAMLRRLLSVALPMVISQASETVMLFADRLFLSRVGQLHFAAAMTGGLATFNIASLFAVPILIIVAIVIPRFLPSWDMTRRRFPWSQPMRAGSSADLCFCSSATA